MPSYISANLKLSTNNTQFCDPKEKFAEINKRICDDKVVIAVEDPLKTKKEALPNTYPNELKVLFICCLGIFMSITTAFYIDNPSFNPNDYIKLCDGTPLNLLKNKIIQVQEQVTILKTTMGYNISAETTTNLKKELKVHERNLKMLEMTFKTKKFESFNYYKDQINKHMNSRPKSVIYGLSILMAYLYLMAFYYLFKAKQQNLTVEHLHNVQEGYMIISFVIFTNVCMFWAFMFQFELETKYAKFPL